MIKTNIQKALDEFITQDNQEALTNSLTSLESNINYYKTQIENGLNDIHTKQCEKQIEENEEIINYINTHNK